MQIRKSADGKRTLILNLKRKKRPKNQEKKASQKKTCPFDPGNEHMTPPQIQDWPVRVVPNKFPILPHHEVIIHSQDHQKDIPDLALSQVRLIIDTYIKRCQALSKYGKVIIYNNAGKKAGASLVHPHSQAVAVPKKIKIKIPPREAPANIIQKNNSFLAYCPYFSQFPYETWISPLPSLKTSFSGLSNGRQTDLAQILQQTLKKITSLETSYNFYLAPFLDDWYIRIIPRLAIPAGLEFATGLSINSTPPAAAAADLNRFNSI